MNKKEIAKALNGKQVLITGGTGSFGKQIVEELFQYDPASIHIFSRDERKQYDMQQMYSNRKKKVHFIIGDVRDLERTREVLRGKNIVFHAAALKQVPNCEFAPYEAVKTNIIGAENLPNGRHGVSFWDNSRLTEVTNNHQAKQISQYYIF